MHTPRDPPALAFGHLLPFIRCAHWACRPALCPASVRSETSLHQALSWSRGSAGGPGGSRGTLRTRLQLAFLRSGFDRRAACARECVFMDVCMRARAHPAP